MYQVIMGAEVHLGEHNVPCGFGQYVHGTVSGQSGMIALSATYYFTLRVCVSVCVCECTCMCVCMDVCLPTASTYTCSQSMHMHSVR